MAACVCCHAARAQQFEMPPSLVEPPPSLRFDPIAADQSPSEPLRLDLAGAMSIATSEPATPNVISAAQRIPSYLHSSPSGVDHRIVRYDVPLSEDTAHSLFRANGIQGKLMDIPSEDPAQKTIRVVRYEVPDDEILLHSEITQKGVHGDLIEVHDDQSWRPQVRFLQPKARVFFDLKRDNDSEFDLFRNGSILASLDVLEIYKPLKLVTDFFADEHSKKVSLHDLGWRFGATLGLGITTALSNGGTDGGGAPIGVGSIGFRYEFPIGPEPPAVLDQNGRPIRLDQRTRVGFEAGLQAGTSTDETIADRFDVGLYIGMMVNTPW
ncbi:hypothetical protein Poly24_41140 [Rosistilla carotiformis]|uniref:Uncharacterized protein n=2 Tax=Rosistilla carotiformis TaxID=2528017 RepID=A0A518JXX7_9BACT|nr:hypothetical protein Poly24_41140 [Rosistilla carotiformis]